MKEVQNINEKGSFHPGFLSKRLRDISTGICYFPEFLGPALLLSRNYHPPYLFRTNNLIFHCLLRSILPIFLPMLPEAVLIWDHQLNHPFLLHIVLTLLINFVVTLRIIFLFSLVILILSSSIVPYKSGLSGPFMLGNLPSDSILRRIELSSEITHHMFSL